MTTNPADNLDPAADLYKQVEVSSSPLRGLYDELCQLDTLRLAYARIKSDPQNYGIINITTLETTEERDVENILQQLSNDLQGRTYEPKKLTQQPPEMSVPERGEMIALRDLVVQAALKRLLESAFPLPSPSDPEPEKTIQWLAGNIDKGLSRVYAVNLSECLDARWQERLVEYACRRIGHPQLDRLAQGSLAAPTQPEHSPQGLLTPVLTDIAFEGIDEILQQARTLGREGNFLHVQCTRVANQLVVLSDHDPRYDWILPAVKARLREELSNFHYDPAAIETQSLDVTCGEPLCFLGFELHLVTGRRGEARVHYQRMKELARCQPESVLPSRRRQGRFHPLRFVRRCASWMGHLSYWQLVQAAYRQVNAIQVGWRHLPITLCPVLLLLFGWRSPVPWLCFLLIFACNWRWTLSLVRPVGTWAWRHKLDVVVGACALVVLVCLALAIHDLRQPSP